MITISSLAEREFERSIELNPRYATARHWFGMSLGAMGRYEEAYTELKRAIRLEPQLSVIHFGLAFVYWCARRYDQAIEACEKALELDPTAGQAYLWLGLASLAKLMHEPAIAAIRKAVEISQAAPVAVACLGEAYAAAGYSDEAQKILQKLSQQRHVTAYFVGRICAALGKNNEALEWLEAGFRSRGEWLILLKTDPRLDGLRPDPRFQYLMRRMNFP